MLITKSWTSWGPAALGVSVYASRANFLSWSLFILVFDLTLFSGGFPIDIVAFAMESGRDGSRAVSALTDEFLDAELAPEMVILPAPGVRADPPGSFAVSKTLITFQDWDVCVSAGGCNRYLPKDEGWGRGNRPVINVSWMDAMAYVARLNMVVSNKGEHPGVYSLPTPTQWQYAASGGVHSVRPWGDDIGHNQTVCRGCGSRWDGHETAPVRSFPPNAFGLFDAIGNVSQWTLTCSDVIEDRHYWEPEQPREGECETSEARGGAWDDLPAHVTLLASQMERRDARSADVGFRIVKNFFRDLTSPPGRSER